MTEAANDLSHLGWQPGSVGELDHRFVKAPYVRLSSARRGIGGDFVYVFDLRVTQPNKSYMSTLQMHSLEHLLLAGFRKYLPAAFINVAPMGCQTGFYLILFNEGRASVVCGVYKKILTEILSADAVPYANEKDCGQFLYHDVERAKEVVEMLLRAESKWLNVFEAAA